MSFVEKSFRVMFLLLLQLAPAIAQDREPMLDENTNQLTHRGIVISLVATAQVEEMRCDIKGQIAAAIAKGARMGIVVDPNNKEDFADILFVASDILKKADFIGAPTWCKRVVPELSNLLNTP